MAEPKSIKLPKIKNKTNKINDGDNMPSIKNEISDASGKLNSVKK